MLRFFFFLSSLVFVSVLKGQNMPPEISNLSATADTGFLKMNVTYNLSDAEHDDIKVTVKLSDDGGKTFLAEISDVIGDHGYPVIPGNSRHISFSYPAGLPLAQAVVKLVADDMHPVDIQDLVNEVDSTFLKNDLSFIEGVRHYIGNPPHLEATKDFIENRFLQAGLQTSRQHFVHQGYDAANILGRLPGDEDESVTYIIDGHFDSVQGSPGADDNGSAVAGMLEALRILSKHRFKNSIRFIGFDFEESTSSLGGLTGSLEYVANGIEPYEDISGVLNFEMIGYYTEKANSQQAPAGFNLIFPDAYNALVADSFRGNFITNVADANSAWLKNTFDSCAAAYVPALKVISLAMPQGIFVPDLARSDHASFWLNGINALMLTDGANFRNTNYHTAKDTMGALNFTFMSNVVKATVATIATLAGIQHSTAAISPVAIQASDCRVKLVPNPSREFVDIFTGDCFEQNVTITIFNLEGKAILKASIQNTKKVNVDISLLGPGLYFAVIKDRNNSVTREFIIE